MNSIFVIKFFLEIKINKNQEGVFYSKKEKKRIDDFIRSNFSYFLIIQKPLFFKKLSL